MDYPMANSEREHEKSKRTKRKVSGKKARKIGKQAKKAKQNSAIFYQLRTKVLTDYQHTGFFNKGAPL